MEQKGNLLPEENQSVKKDLVQLKFIAKYEMDHEKLNPDDGIYGYSFFDIDYDYQNKDFLNIDNEGNVLLIQPERNIFLINGKDEWDTFKSYYSKYGINQINEIEKIRIRHDCVVLKYHNFIFTLFINYKLRRIETMKEWKHKAVDNFDCIYPTKIPKIFIFIYKFGDSNK